MVKSGAVRPGLVVLAFIGATWIPAIAQENPGNKSPQMAPAMLEKVKGAFASKKGFFKAEEVVEPKKDRTLKDEIQQLFREFSCQLPEAVAKKISESVKDKDGFIPRDLEAKLFPASEPLPLYSSINGQAAAAALATLRLKAAGPDGNPIKIRLKSSSIYARLDPMGLIDKSSDSIVYAIDCSNYLNSAFTLEALIPGAQAKAFAEAQLSGSRALAVSMATVTSPVMAALVPLSVPDQKRLSTRDRLELLVSAIMELALVRPGTKEEEEFEVQRELRLLWTSNNGTSSTDASAKVQGSGGGGLGIVSGSASSDAGGTISREMKFASFDTYLIQDGNLQLPVSMTVGELKKLVIQLVAAAASSSPETVNAGQVMNRYVASFRDFTKSICEMEWAPAQENLGTISRAWDQNKDICVFSFIPQTAEVVKNLKSLNLKVNAVWPMQPPVELTVTMPIVAAQ